MDQSERETWAQVLAPPWASDVMGLWSLGNVSGYPEKDNNTQLMGSLCGFKGGEAGKALRTGRGTCKSCRYSVCTHGLNLRHQLDLGLSVLHSGLVKVKAILGVHLFLEQPISLARIQNTPGTLQLRCSYTEDRAGSMNHGVWCLVGCPYQ